MDECVGLEVASGLGELGRENGGDERGADDGRDSPYGRWYLESFWRVTRCRDHQASVDEVVGRSIGRCVCLSFTGVGVTRLWRWVSIPDLVELICHLLDVHTRAICPETSHPARAMQPGFIVVGTVHKGEVTES